MTEEELFDISDDDGLEDDEEEYFDCAMDQDGGCGKAGSEECDWECPYEKPWERKRKDATV